MADQLLTLLATARRFNNQTVTDAWEAAEWHRQVDDALRDTAYDDPDERYDAPARKEHREWMARMLRAR